MPLATLVEDADEGKNVLNAKRKYPLTREDLVSVYAVKTHTVNMVSLHAIICT